MGGLYILKGKETIPVDNPMDWFQGFQSNERIVKQEDVGDYFVSTVFLGIDHSYDDGPPLLFETMIFGGVGEYQERYSTWDEAEAGHEKAVELVKSGNYESEQREYNSTSD